MENAYNELKSTLWAEYAECEGSAVLDGMVNQSLANSSEETDFDSWAACTARSVEAHLPIIKEWGLSQ